MASHGEYFPENFGAYSEEQGKRFNQDIKVMEQRYQGRQDGNMIADYCWILKTDLPYNKIKMPLGRSFESKRAHYNKNKQLFFHRESQWYAELYIKATSSRDYLINDKKISLIHQ